MQQVNAAALNNSISDSASYGAGLKKFHTFCDIFSIPEAERLPASFDTLLSFVLWATADESWAPPQSSTSHPMEPVSVTTARHYLSAIRAWHITQGWKPPLTDKDLDLINFPLRGIEKFQAEHHKKPIHQQQRKRLISTFLLFLTYPYFIYSRSTQVFFQLIQ